MRNCVWITTPKWDCADFYWGNPSKIGLKDDSNDELEGSKPLCGRHVGCFGPKKFQAFHSATFDGKNDPKDNLSWINAHMPIIDAAEPLKCKIFIARIERECITLM